MSENDIQKATYTNVQLGNADKVRLNFTLQVATQAQSVEVTVAADTLLAEDLTGIYQVIGESHDRFVGSRPGGITEA